MSEVPIPPSIRVFPGATIGRADINSGDKIILPPHILIACEQQELSYPMVSTGGYVVVRGTAGYVLEKGQLGM